jgi:DeoR family transcriptional regulator of aga operon/DeoR family fructose operon transcriptional repressor
MSTRLFQPERLRQIQELLTERGRVSVTDLSRRFEVSTVTVRSDLAALERQGLLVRTHGGAVPRFERGPEPLAFALRKEQRLVEKTRIGQAAASLIRDGDAIALDASTTAWQVARHLKDRRELTVITNGLFIAQEFLDSPGVTVVMPGGSLRSASASLVGNEGSGILERYHVRRGFFGAGGFSIDEGLTDTNQYEVELKQRMIERSKQVVAIVDSSKWGQVTLAPLADVSQLDLVISDAGAPAGMVARLRELDVTVTLV